MPSEYVVRTAEGETGEGGSSPGSDRTIPVELTEVNSRPWVGRLGGEEVMYAQLQPGSTSSVWNKHSNTKQGDREVDVLGIHLEVQPDAWKGQTAPQRDGINDVPGLK